MGTAERKKILIVDDSEMNRSILDDMLADEFDVEEAENGVAAVEMLSQRADRYSLILLDIVMPEMDGFGVLETMNERGWIDFLPVIMITAETQSALIERAFNLGVTDFIMRPFDASIVHRRVVNTVLLYGKQKKLVGIIEDQIYEKEQNNSMMVDVLSHIVEFRNGESGLHIRNVRVLTDFFLTALNRITDKYRMTESEIAVISMASALHDIGKISIDEKILNKPGRLTDEEYAVMKSHSLIGAKMLENIRGYDNNPLIRRAYEICRWHHERWDGRGYPDGLAGDAIPISAQIVALADVYDALVSERVYKKALPPDEAVRTIVDGKCGAFNPLLLRCLVENADGIRDALKIDIVGKQVDIGIRGFAESVLHSKAVGVSDRTLRLLDYERMKYDFFAALTQEIQFEYSAADGTLRLSPFGAKLLGIPESVRISDCKDRLDELMNASWRDKLREACLSTTPEHPEFRREMKVRIGDEIKWFTAIVRVTWSDDAPSRIDGMIGKMVDMTESHDKIGKLLDKANHDTLTGLWNRSGLREQVEKRLVKFPVHKYAIVLFDIDFFKRANDTFGHLFGDKVLVDVADRLRRSTRGYDVCARIGGDEFLIFLEYDTDIRPIVDRIFHRLSGKIDNFDLSVSMGVVEMTDEGQTYEELFHKADIALYCSKRNGRAQYRMFDDTMDDVLCDDISDISEIVETSDSIGGSGETSRPDTAEGGED